MSHFDLSGKTILVTGASSGIGRGIALACAAAGANCILVGRNKERLEAAKAECAGDGHVVEIVEMTDGEAMKSLVERIPVQDGLVQCAGVGDKQLPLKFLSADFIDEVLAVNLRAPMAFLAMLEKKKKLNRGASVVMMSSISSFHATPAHSLYCASKAGLTAFTKAAALDLAGKKIRVNAIAPGRVNTPMIEYSNISEEQRLADIAKYPLKRYGEVLDVVNLALYLLSDASSWVTGQEFVVDGGISLT